MEGIGADNEDTPNAIFDKDNWRIAEGNLVKYIVAMQQVMSVPDVLSVAGPDDTKVNLDLQIQGALFLDPVSELTCVAPPVVPTLPCMY